MVLCGGQSHLSSTRSCEGAAPTVPIAELMKWKKRRRLGLALGTSIQVEGLKSTPITSISTRKKGQSRVGNAGWIRKQEA
jgi:hypothetical protein